MLDEDMTHADLTSRRHAKFFHVVEKWREIKMSLKKQIKLSIIADYDFHWLATCHLPTEKLLFKVKNECQWCQCWINLGWEQMLHRTNSQIIVKAESAPFAHITIWSSWNLIMSRLFVVIVVLQFVHSHGFTIKPRIIDGTESNPGAFPFFVNIVYNGDICGGSLLNEKWDSKLDLFKLLTFFNAHRLEWVSDILKR